MTFTKVLAIVAAVVLLTVGMACAGDITVPNGSFENQTTSWGNAGDSMNAWGGGAYGGWSVIDATAGKGTASDGNNFEFVYPGGYLSNGTVAKNNCGIYTNPITIPGGILAGTTYTFSFDGGQSTEGAVTAPGMQFTAYIQDGSTILATGVTVTAPEPALSWTTATVSWTATTSSSDSLVLSAIASNMTSNGGWNTNDAQFDNFKLTASSPEPATLTLLATGLVSLLAYAWRRRRA
jgi:hypothetical protein